mgnify:CR=1 FL=1
MTPDFDKCINVDNSDILFEEMKCAFQSLDYFKYVEYEGQPISYFDNPKNGISSLQYEAIEGAREVCYSISNNFDIVKPYKTPREPRDFEDIVNLIKKGKKINMCYVNQFTFDYYDNSISIEISGFEIVDRPHEIPMECLEIYSPRNNIYFIICECMKNISFVSNNDKNGYITRYSVGVEKIRIMYRDEFGCLNKGYVSVTSNIDNSDVVNIFYCGGNKGWKCMNYDGKYNYINAKNKFFDFVNKNNITFDLKIYDSYHTQINTIKCTINFKDNFCCKIHNENNINIIYVGDIHIIHHNTHLGINESLDYRINIIEKNIISDDYIYFNYIKNARKQFIRAVQENPFNVGCYELNNWKRNIKNISKKMLKYKDIRNKYIKNKIYTFTLCLQKNEIHVPDEMWIAILYYNNFKI